MPLSFRYSIYFLLLNMPIDSYICFNFLRLILLKKQCNCMRYKGSFVIVRVGSNDVGINKLGMFGKYFCEKRVNSK